MADRPSVVVTGAAGGIGQAMCTVLAEEGWAVVGVDLNAEALDEVVSGLPGEGHAAVAGDITDEAVMVAAVDTADSAAPLRGFVGNAGIIGPGDSVDYPLEQWNRLIDVMLTGVFLGARVAGARMLANGAGGSMVMTSSIAGLLGFGARASYCAAKAGVNGLVRSLAVEWGAQGIRVNGVAPGAIVTPLQKAMIATGHSQADQYLTHIPMDRLGDPREIADVAAYLLSDRASYVTGTVIPVDGGWTAFGLATHPS